MNGTEVQLTDMMHCRDRRADIQTQYLAKYNCPVISFCMNIPGPIKTNDLIRAAFDQGRDELLRKLQAASVTIQDSVEFHDATGDEVILAVDFPASEIKKITSAIEENHSFGRLFDMDVIDITGVKLSRDSYRKCIICDCQAQECARSRKHTVQEMQDKIEEMLSRGV